ncbi:MAG: hypothetical protein L3K05_02490 [Thermoplasmata archaeon]|nr:hypothetical protein [Thermoplasmata archaeon]
MYDPSAGMPAPPPPPDDSARYAYLVARLRNHQITMSEATELFELQQSTLSAALAGTARSAALPPPPDADQPPAPSAPLSGAPSDDMFWMGLLAIGAGAGVLAAIFRRSQANPPVSAPPQSKSP